MFGDDDKYRVIPRASRIDHWMGHLARRVLWLRSQGNGRGDIEVKPPRQLFGVFLEHLQATNAKPFCNADPETLLIRGVKLEKEELDVCFAWRDESWNLSPYDRRVKLIGVDGVAAYPPVDFGLILDVAYLQEGAKQLLRLRQAGGGENRDGSIDPAGHVVSIDPERLAHLQPDAPFAVCNRCGRKSWGLFSEGMICGMPQPDGRRCDGMFIDPLIQTPPSAAGEG